MNTIKYNGSIQIYIENPGDVDLAKLGEEVTLAVGEKLNDLKVSIDDAEMKISSTMVTIDPLFEILNAGLGPAVPVPETPIIPTDVVGTTDG